MKAVMLDMDIAISTYLEELDAKRQALEEERARDAANQAAIVSALGEALARVARGDLTARVNGAMASEFQALQGDFNNALRMLEEAMGQVAGATEGIRLGADEIGLAADDLSRRTEQQAASLEETAAALDEITATVRTTAERRQAGLATWSPRPRPTPRPLGRGGQRRRRAMGQIESPRRADRQDHGRDRRDRLPDQPSGPERRASKPPGPATPVAASPSSPRKCGPWPSARPTRPRKSRSLISTSTRQVEAGVSLVGQTGEALARHRRQGRADQRRGHRASPPRPRNSPRACTRSISP
jgi:methyl-accepting chemotaxis protein